MKLSTIFILFTLSVIVKGWAALLQPFALSIGAGVLTMLNFDIDLIDKPLVWTKTRESKSYKPKPKTDYPTNIDTTTFPC